MFTISIAMALPFSLVGVPLFFSPFLAPIFFLIFKHLEGKQKLVVSKFIKISMQGAIVIVALWIAARLFASTIPGGGAGFVVAQYGIITLIPALGAAVPVLPGSPVNSWFPDKLFANFLGYSKGHASVNS